MGEEDGVGGGEGVERTGNEEREGAGGRGRCRDREVIGRSRCKRK